MAITVLPDIIIPNSVIAAGVRGKNIRNNTRVTTYNGEQQVNVNWTRTVRQYELGVVPMLIEQWQQIEALYEVTDGGAYGMLLRDPKDDTVAATEGKLYGTAVGLNWGESGKGYGLPYYNLMKRYTVTGTTRFRDRKITRPIVVPTVYKNGILVNPGTAPGQYAFNFLTGIVAFVPLASNAADTATPGAVTAFAFPSSGFVAQLSVGKRLYLSGVTGTAMSVLNNRSHEITNITGLTVTIAANTTGMTILSALGELHPQSTDTLTWQGNFYVPVHFLDDAIDWDLALGGNYENRLVAGPQVVLQEVRES